MLGFELHRAEYLESVTGDQSSFQSYSTGEGHDATFAKRHGALAKERRENRSLDGRNVRALDDARQSKVGEDCHSSHSSYSERTRKPCSGMTRDEDADN